MLDFRLAFFLQNDTYSIITKFYRFQMHNFAIHTRGADDLPLFSQVNRGKRRSKLVGTSGFDFDKTQRRFVIHDQINFAGDNRAAPVSADGRFEIGADDSAAASHQKIQREPLAFRTNFA